MSKFMTRIAIFLFFLLTTFTVFAGGAPSTYFNIYIPPNNDAVQRNVALIVTALYDDTHFDIVDDNADGDDDDTVSGVLQSGQSYILYIKDNGINDDALYASGGVLKRDGDYFTITSTKQVLASMSTDSDWQHDFVPSFNKTSLGEKFVVYSPKTSNSKRDLNVFAYEDNTSVTISKISTIPTIQTGFTNIDLSQKTIVKQRTLNRGQDIIHFFQDGRDIMDTGATYMIESNKPISLQYGALWGNARDGGGYVPSSNGSSSGDLFYFAVPHQANGEQEIRVVSWDADNTVVLERYDNGNWIQVTSWQLGINMPGDWIGKKNGNVTFPTVFRMSCTQGKRISVFECNWMETGSIGTSDMASMVSSKAGTDSGQEFLVYLLPPAKQQNVVNPFTGQLFGSNFTHCYLYAGDQQATVTIKDAQSNGSIINRTYTVDPHRYVDVIFSVADWYSIYNGNGNPDSGPQRPYILVESDQNIAVMNANTNDNWMMYFGSSLPSAFSISNNTSQSTVIPGDTVTYNANISIHTSSIDNAEIEVHLSSGAIPVSSQLTIDDQTYYGVISQNEQQSTIIYSDLPVLTNQNTILLEVTYAISPSYNNGTLIPNNTVIGLEAIITGAADGLIQQTTDIYGVQYLDSDLSNLSFVSCMQDVLSVASSDSWNNAWVDYNNDGWEDLFVADRDPSKPNLLYTNTNGNQFVSSTSLPITQLYEKTIGSAWGDYNNDGFIDVLIVNATGTKSRLFKNTGTNFVEITQSGLDINPQYFHGAAWFDMDNDGDLDLIITNYFETNYHQMYDNQGNDTFMRITDNAVTSESNRATMPALSDYNNDGLVDIFIPNGENKPNSLFKNLGNGLFAKMSNIGPIVTDLDNSVGASWGDYDNDGHMDLLVLNASKQPNRLYKNNGDGTFQKIVDTPLSDVGADTHSALWIDHDNDGDLDVFVTNDEGKNYFYINDGNGQFTPKYTELITANTGNTMGVSLADYNKDGKVDIHLVTHSNDMNTLYCNQTYNDNNFVNIRLIGSNSNTSAIGAKIKVTAGPLIQHREVLPIQGVGSQNSLRQHFGLSDQNTISSIEVHWPSGYVQTVEQVNVNQFITIVEEEANTISGFTFSDENGNCVWDNGEEKISSITFRFTQDNTLFVSRDSGIYDINMGQGIYDVALESNEFWSLGCPTQINVQGTNNTYNANIPLSKSINGHDLSISIGNTAWRRGFAGESVVMCSNIGTSDAVNTAIEITYPEGIVLNSASTPWSENIGNTYIWYFDTLVSGQTKHIVLYDSVTLNLSVGDTITLAGVSSSDGVDLRIENNSYIMTSEIVGAIDPNDILVSPRGNGKEGFIPRDQVLRYHIRFQNVGTYYASRVVLDNQLSRFLDYQTFKIESVSHDNYTVKIDDNGHLIIRFDNIELPDSTRDEAGSHGFFIYTIKPKSTLNGGERIDNSVLISFDYEDPIQSNTVVNTIKYAGKPETKSLILFPNPASEWVECLGDTGQASDDPPILHTVQIFNNTHQKITEVQNNTLYSIPIDVHTLPSGTYHVIGYDYNGLRYVGQLIKM